MGRALVQNDRDWLQGAICLRLIAVSINWTATVWRQVVSHQATCANTYSSDWKWSPRGWRYYTFNLLVPAATCNLVTSHPDLSVTESWVTTFATTSQYVSCSCESEALLSCSGHRRAAGADGGGDHQLTVWPGQRLLPEGVWLLQRNNQCISHY